MTFSINITNRKRTRTLKSGAVVHQTRYVLNYQDPKTKRRRQEFFECQKEAITRRNDLLVQVESGSYSDIRTAPTVGEAIDHWLADREGKVKASTLEGYKIVIKNIRGPLLVGTSKERHEFTETGHKPPGATFLPMLGNRKTPTSPRPKSAPGTGHWSSRSAPTRPIGRSRTCGQSSPSPRRISTYARRRCPTTLAGVGLS